MNWNHGLGASDNEQKTRSFMNKAFQFKTKIYIIAQKRAFYIKGFR